MIMTTNNYTKSRLFFNNSKKEKRNQFYDSIKKNFNWSIINYDMEKINDIVFECEGTPIKDLTTLLKQFPFCSFTCSFCGFQIGTICGKIHTTGDEDLPYELERYAACSKEAYETVVQVYGNGSTFELKNGEYKLNLIEMI